MQCWLIYTVKLLEKILWDPDEKNLEAQIRDNEFYIALEWQYGHQDHTVLDLVERIRERDTILADALADLADNYEYKKILALIARAEENNG